MPQGFAMKENMQIAVLGAGAIGCFVGGLFADMGYNPILIGRERVLGPLKTHGLSLDADESITVDPTAFETATSAGALARADIIFVATKAVALDQVIRDLEMNVKAETIIVSLLNGVAPVRLLKAALPESTVLAGMVPFNAVWKDDHSLVQSSVGKIAVEKHAAIEALFNGRSEWFDMSSDIDAIQYGKLLLNLINPVNALSGMPVVKMFRDRGYRTLYADAVSEALTVYQAANQPYINQAALPVKLAMAMMRGPDWLIEKLVIARQKLNPNTMSSMAQDYLAKRPTEIDFINGEIVAMGRTLGVPTPINSALVDWVKAAETRGWPNPSPDEIRSGL